MELTDVPYPTLSLYGTVITVTVKFTNANKKLINIIVPTEKMDSIKGSNKIE